MACQKVIHLCDMFYFNSENGSFFINNIPVVRSVRVVYRSLSTTTLFHPLTFTPLMIAIL